MHAFDQPIQGDGEQVMVIYFHGPGWFYAQLRRKPIALSGTADEMNGLWRLFRRATGDRIFTIHTQDGPTEVRKSTIASIALGRAK